MPELPSWLRVARGVVLMVIGIAGMVKQILSPGLDWQEVALYMACIGGEGVLSSFYLATKSNGQSSASPQVASSGQPSESNSSTER